MVKEAYAIYMTLKKSTFYLTGQEITLRSDHLPLKKFLNHRTLNNTVDNWAVEIESFKIKFVHITGKDNILTDTLSRLINIDPDVEQEPELKDYEFGCYAFDTLPKAKGTPVGETLASVTAWRNHISFPFGVCRKLLADNGMEFKNELFNTIAEQLGGRERSTHHHTGLNQMVALKVFTIS